MSRDRIIQDDLRKALCLEQLGDQEPGHFKSAISPRDV